MERSRHRRANIGDNTPTPSAPSSTPVAEVARGTFQTATSNQHQGVDRFTSAWTELLGDKGNTQFGSVVPVVGVPPHLWHKYQGVDQQLAEDTGLPLEPRPRSSRLLGLQTALGCSKGIVKNPQKGSVNNSQFNVASPHPTSSVVELNDWTPAVPSHSGRNPENPQSTEASKPLSPRGSIRGTQPAPVWSKENVENPQFNKASHQPTSQVVEPNQWNLSREQADESKRDYWVTKPIASEPESTSDWSPLSPDGEAPLLYPHEVRTGYCAGPWKRTKKVNKDQNRASGSSVALVQPATYQHIERGKLMHNPRNQPTPVPSAGGSLSPVAEVQKRSTPTWQEPVWGNPSLENSDLLRFKNPRPNKNYFASENSSLSSIILSDTGTDQRSVRNGPRDIRHQIAPKHSLHDYDGKWVKHSWNDNESDRPPDYAVAFIHAWISGVTDDVRPNFLRMNVEHHWCNDVDTDTGRLVDRVDYPDTIRHPDPIENREEFFRQGNWTSNLAVCREMQGLKWKGEKSKRPRNQAPAVSSALPQQQQPARTYLPGEPKIACYMRPAVAKDMEEVSEIYNLEVEMEESSQATDLEPLSEEDFRSIFRVCEEKKKPFLVVIEEPFEPVQTTTVLQYSQYQRQVPQQQANSDCKIIAFGLVYYHARGLVGDTTSVAHTTGQLLVFVHPAYRRQGLGTMCVDKLMSCVDYNHRGLPGYSFVNPRNDPVYGPPSEPECNFKTVVAEFFIKRMECLTQSQRIVFDDMEWLHHFLVQKFGFKKIGAIGMFAQSRHGHTMDKAIYAHDCGSPKDLSTN